MRFYLDECISYRVLDPLRAVYPDHDFLDCFHEGLKGTKDVPLFGEMRARSIDVFLTFDRSQLYNSEELAAIRGGGCHWVGFTSPKGSGKSQVARIASTLLNTTTFILDSAPPVPTAFRPKLTGREHRELFSFMEPIAAI